MVFRRKKSCPGSRAKPELALDRYEPASGTGVSVSLKHGADAASKKLPPENLNRFSIFQGSFFQNFCALLYTPAAGATAADSARALLRSSISLTTWAYFSLESGYKAMRTNWITVIIAGRINIVNRIMEMASGL